MNGVRKNRFIVRC